MELKVTVPPNTTALVSLPGREEAPLEVSSGTHRWSYAYQDPDARSPLSPDNTIGEILDEPGAWAAVKEVLDRLIPENGFVLYVLRSQRRRRLREGLMTLPDADEVLTAVTDALARVGQNH